MSGFRAVLDTCVLVPIVKADLLLTLARRQAFHPLWSSAILDELSAAIVKVRSGMTEERAALRLQQMNHAFEDALVWGWEPLTDSITGLPDPDDRHVVAAAIRGNAAAIITDNIRDFPGEALEPLDLHALTSDEFLLDILDLDERRMMNSLTEIAEKRRNPPVRIIDVLDALESAGTPRFVREIRRILDDWP